ncbi:exo-alpha-sialidase [Trypanosoma cruzi]|nr:exo-alpha-sialidase [Trypanosoma cruzi]
MVDRCRQKSGNVVRKFTQLTMRHFANKPLISCPSKFERHTPLRACQCPMNGCVHAEVLVPPLGTGYVTKQPTSPSVGAGPLSIPFVLRSTLPLGLRFRRAVFTSFQLLTISIIQFLCSLRRTEARMHDTTSDLFSNSEINSLPTP